MESEALHQMQARHRRELRELQGRITSKKKNATKKTRKGVNDECAEMERLLREEQASEVAALKGQDDDDDDDDTAREPSTRRQRDQDDDDEATSKLDVGSSSAERSGQEEQEGEGEQPPPPSHQEGTKNKKRNRQRERLARRAAEQEDAARKAEDEASRMTDYRAREGESVRRMVLTHGLVEKEIEPDGHCLFSAVADQLAVNGVALGEGEGADVPPYRVVRRTAAAFMRENREDFEPFVEGGELESYVERIRETAEWGGELELTAVARRYGVEIRVVQDGRTERIGEEGGKVLWLAYYRHGYGLGEHYNSLRKK